MSKRKIQIGLLFIVFIILIVIGCKFFSDLNYNKKVADTNIFEYVDASSRNLTVFNNKYNLERFVPLDSTDWLIPSSIQNGINYPLLCLKFYDDTELYLFKAKTAQQKDFQKTLINTFANQKATAKEYQSVTISFYPMSNEQFLIVATHNGITALSTSYEKIKQFIEINTQNSFFYLNGTFSGPTDTENRSTASALIYTKSENCIFAMSYNNEQTTITLRGSVIGKSIEDNVFEKIEAAVNPSNGFECYSQWIDADSTKFELKINKLAENRVIEIDKE